MMLADASQDGWTPLHRASQNGHLEVVKLLLEHKVDAEVKNTVRLSYTRQALSRTLSLVCVHHVYVGALSYGVGMGC